MNQYKLVRKLLLNMQMLVDDLEEEYDIIYFFSKNDQQKLQGVEAYYGQKQLNPAFVYVADEQVFEQYPISGSDIFRISIGNSEDMQHSETEAPLIKIRNTAPWPKILNSVQGVFNRYFQLWRRMMLILNNGGSLYELCVAAMDFFRNPLYVHDENFNILAMPTWVVGMGELNVDKQTGKTTVPLQKIREFNVNTEYIKTLATRGVQLWNPIYGRHRDIYVNIWTSGQKYCGRLLINELSSSLKPSDFVMAEYFAEILTIAVEREMFKSENQITFEHVLWQVYTGETVERQYLLNRLKMVGWKPNQDYICFRIELEKEDSDVLSCQRISSTMGIVLKQSFSFIHNQKILTICNATKSGWSVRDYETKLIELSDVTGITAGASNVFKDFLKINSYFRQAEIAILMGKNKSPENKYFQFEKYTLDYILRHFTEELDIATVCPTSIQRLIEIDREKNTDYIKTLKCYFSNNCQQTATASELYIHRSTLIYRLEKIQEICEMDFNDVDTKLLLQISIRLLGE